MGVIPAKQDRVWSFLEKASSPELCKFSFFDFISHVKPFMLSSEAQNCIDEFSKIMENTPEAEFELYVLAFVYRDTPFLQSQYSLYESQSKQEPLIPLFEGSGRPFETYTAGSMNPTIFRLKREASSLIKKIFAEGETIKKLTKKRRSDPLKEKFKKLFDLEQTQKVVIIDELEKISGLNRKEFSKKVYSLKRKYYRWKDSYSNELINRKWPTEDFLAFLALLSLKYEKISQEYFILKDVSQSDYNVSMIRKYGMNPYSFRNSNKELQKYKFERAKKLKGKNKEEKLKKLAGENNLSAIKAYCGIVSEKAGEKYVLQGAILGDVEYARKQDWKARGFAELPLEVCDRYTKLRVRENMHSSSGKPILRNSKIISFSFNIDATGEKWAELYSQIQGKNLSPCKYHTFSDSTPINTATIKATPKNMDLLMKYADILPPFFEIEFPNKQYIYTQIWRGKIQSPEEPLQNEEPVKEETPKPPVKQWTAREKLEIALLGSNPAWTIDDLCRMHGITKEMYYKWSAQLSKALPKIFECGGEDPSGEQGLETSKPKV